MKSISVRLVGFLGLFAFCALSETWFRPRPSCRKFKINGKTYANCFYGTAKTRTSTSTSTKTSTSTSTSTSSSTTTSTSTTKAPVTIPANVQNYWNFNNNYKDNITGYNLINPFQASFIADRFGSANKALYLNNGYVQIDASYASININGEVTFALWKYTISYTTAPRIFACGVYIQTYIDLGTVGYNADQFVYSRLNSAYTDVLAGSPTIVYNQWVHHAAIFKYNSVNNNYQASLWTNLIMTAQGNQVQPVSASRGSTCCYIGNSCVGDTPAKVYIDDFFIFTRALSLSELTAVYNYNS